MKKTLPFCVASLLIGVTTMLYGSQDRGGSEGDRDRFVGAWRLAWLEAQRGDGKIHRSDSVGLLVFTRDGHMSVQVMERNPQAQTSDGPEQYSQGGYEASFGTYQIGEGTHTFTFHVEGALVRTLIGKDLPRAFELSGKQLIVKSTRPDEHWKVAWERYARTDKMSHEQYWKSQPTSRGDTGMTKEPSAAQKLIGDFDPKLAELTDNVLFGDVWERPGLSKRDRSLITVAALIALNRPEQLRSHFRLARENGVTKDEVVEVITHLAFYTGWPNAINAVAIARETFQ